MEKMNSMSIYGQCVNNDKMQQLDTLTNEKIHYSCSGSSIDCSSDYCDPGSFDFQYKSLSNRNSPDTLNDSNDARNRPIVIILSIIFSIIGCLIIITIGILIYRWKNDKELFCCDFLSKSPRTINEITRRHRLQHKKEIINKNPTVIESVITHGANMNVPPYSEDQNDDFSNQTTSNTKRKLYNPMFADSPKSSIRYHQSEIQSNGAGPHTNQMYSEDS